VIRILVVLVTAVKRFIVHAPGMKKCKHATDEILSIDISDID
jgi:hypothetical protein